MKRSLVPLSLVLLLVAPTAATLAIPLPVADFPAPLDVDDATLLRLLKPDLALRSNAELHALLNPHATIPDLLHSIATRMGTTLVDEDIAMFTELDVRVAEPTRLMLAAIDAAWRLRDEAFSGLTPEEELELMRLTFAGESMTPRAVELPGPIDDRALIESAILLLDTAETIVIPLLMQAVEDGAWPATAVADPVGILRLGGTGNDVETLNRVLQIDPRGDDIHRNNAGGTNFNELLTHPTDLRYQIALSIDFDGNDYYDKFANIEAQGGGAFGVGVMLDLKGDDTYRCRIRCQGAGSGGVGFFRDFEGNDQTITSGGLSKGMGERGYGIYRDDSGDDSHYCGGSCGGYGVLDGAIGLMWDRDGSDVYDPNDDIRSIAWATDNGKGWFVDEGDQIDYYDAATLPGPNAHGCNTCTWATGNSGRGRGNDNAGGLAFLMTRQDSFP